MRIGRGWGFIGALTSTLTLAACGGHAPRPAPIAPVGAGPSGSAVKIGKPYTVLGATYYPADDTRYDEQGIASWYGPGFHALATANGERYDQDGITAAHKTLPMPSYVEVENLDNGRRLTVRVNDRGPFVAGRIIDLSRRSAQLLGVDRPGTARVRVRRVFPDGTTLAALAPPPVSVAVVPAPAPVAVAHADILPTVTAAPIPETPTGSSFVQVAALSDAGRTAWLKGYLTVFGPVVTEPAANGLTRIRLGPYKTVDKANAALAQVRAAGYSDARLVTAKP
jgi:rare lipoprotein A